MTTQPLWCPFSSLPDQFVQSVGVASSDAASPADCSIEECTSNKRLVENVQQPAAHAEGSQLPQEVEPCHHLLVHSLSVGPLVQFAVKVPPDTCSP